MEAVAALLRGLPLQPEESDRGDLMEAKSQLFLKQVSLLLIRWLPTNYNLMELYQQNFIKFSLDISPYLKIY